MLSKEAKGKWKAMTKDEKVEYTAEAVKELAERQEMKTFAPHNVPIAAFHDVFSVQSSIATQVRASFFDLNRKI